MKAVVGLAVAAVLTMASSVAWITIHPINSSPFNVDQVIAFLNRDDHSKFRYITLGFGSQFAEVSTYANADSVDGDYNSARLLPEMTAYGAGQLYNSKYYGLAGMESLRAVLKHANQYGLKYIFVRDRYYEPLLAFAGWRKAETYDNGNVTLWTKEDVPPARPLEFDRLPPDAKCRASCGESCPWPAACWLCSWCCWCRSGAAWRRPWNSLTRATA